MSNQPRFNNTKIVLASIFILILFLLYVYIFTVNGNVYKGMTYISTFFVLFLSLMLIFKTDNCFTIAGIILISGAIAGASIWYLFPSNGNVWSYTLYGASFSFIWMSIEVYANKGSCR